MKKFSLGLIIFIISLFSPKLTRAGEFVVSSSASSRRQISEPKKASYDTRVIRLKNFLDSYSSPLAEYASEFVKKADQYGLDWRLVASIAGVESSFGKRIPYASYNAYGWANGKYKFSSWEESIDIVSRSLRENYYNKGAVSINKISKKYAPPSKTWAWKVKFFMEKIDPTPVEFDI